MIDLLIKGTRETQRDRKFKEKPAWNSPELYANTERS